MPVECRSAQGRMEWIVWSGWRDLNSRPLDPQLPATRPLPYAGVRKSLPVRNPFGSEHERTHQDDHGWRSELRSKP